MAGGFRDLFAWVFRWMSSTTLTERVLIIATDTTGDMAITTSTTDAFYVSTNTTADMLITTGTTGGQ